MSVAFKKILRKNPQNKEDQGKYYPQLVVIGKAVNLDVLVAKMKDKSSLSAGDIHSVLRNFVEAMREELYNGHSVSIADFGVFSLSAQTEGSVNREECRADKIRTLCINFVASNRIRPSVKATRAEDKIEFVDFDTLTASASNSGSSTGSTGNESGSGSDTGGTSGSGSSDDDIEGI